jgi:hypothetical protein
MIFFCISKENLYNEGQNLKRRKYLQNSGQVFDNKDDAVAEDSKPNRQNFGDNGGSLISQLHTTACLNKVPE